LKIGDISIECYVLEHGERVLVASGLVIGQRTCRARSIQKAWQGRQSGARIRRGAASRSLHGDHPPGPDVVELLDWEGAHEA